MAIPAYLWLKDDGGALIKGAVDFKGRESCIEVNPDPHGDDPTDQTWIRAGIDYAQRAGF